MCGALHLPSVSVSPALPVSLSLTVSSLPCLPACLTAAQPLYLAASHLQIQIVGEGNASRGAMKGDFPQRLPDQRPIMHRLACTPAHEHRPRTHHLLCLLGCVGLGWAGLGWAGLGAGVWV